MNNNIIHHCQAIVVSCMDFRLQKSIEDWSRKNIKRGYDRVSVAGGVKNLPFILEQIGLSYKLHHIKEVYLINHEDCGAYGEEGNLGRHKRDLNLAKKAIMRKFPDLKVVLLYQKLKGEFIEISRR